MNTSILNKCIEELKKESPDLSYIRGILETLVESTQTHSVSALSQWQPITPQPYTITTSAVPNHVETDEQRYFREQQGPVAELHQS